MIKLIRLDYRLLHGQVVFAWVNAIGAQRIIIVNDVAAVSETQKAVLKLAKPAGVKLNIFSVSKFLEKMPKIQSLDERIMVIFGNVPELKTFIDAYPEYKTINYGAMPNQPGCTQIGGSDSSVFLDEKSLEQTRELLANGEHIFIQQTPSHVRIDLTEV